MSAALQRIAEVVRAYIAIIAVDWREHTSIGRALVDGTIVVIVAGHVCAWILGAVRDGDEVASWDKPLRKKIGVLGDREVTE